MVKEICHMVLGKCQLVLERCQMKLSTKECFGSAKFSVYKYCTHKLTQINTQKYFENT